MVNMSEEVLNELQLLTAMYDPSDIKFHDPEVHKLVENCIPISDSVSLTLRLNDLLELDIRLPLGYPEKERLSAHCKVSRTRRSSHGASVQGAGAGTASNATKLMQWEIQLNKNLGEFVVGMSGDGAEEYPNILGVIQWCNEQSESSPTPMEPNNGSFNSTSTSDLFDKSN